MNLKEVILEDVQGQKYRQLTFGVLDSPAKIYQSQESNLDLLENGADCSTKSCESCKKLKKKIDPSTCSLKMLKTFFQSIEDWTSSIYSIRWMKLGMMQSGNFSTQKISEYPKIVRECSLSDILEEEVDEKYFLSNEVVERLISKAESSEYKNPKAKYRPSIGDGSYALRSQEFVRTGFTSECLTLSARDYKDPKCVCVPIKEATKKGYAIAEEGDSINLAFPDSQTRRGRVGKEVAQTLDRNCNQGTLTEGRIRRLTPKECWRLQGISDEITEKVIAVGISDTQMYRSAGDACTTNVIYEIARRL